MIIRFKVYKNSIAATLLDLLGAAFRIMGAMLVLFVVIELIRDPSSVSDIRISDAVSGFITLTILFLLGVWFGKMAEKLAERKRFKNRK